MGVQLYLLDRRPTTLVVGGTSHKIGTLRRFWKVTELNNARMTEIDAAQGRIRQKPAPVAVMLNDVMEAALEMEPGRNLPAHVVLGWDADRVSVTDQGWEYLPVLGYAVRSPETGIYVLHETGEGEGGLLRPVTRDRAIQHGLITTDNQLVRHGQPRITTCLSVTPLIETYAEADCLLADGRSTRILTSITSGRLPDPAWYAGKRPADVKAYLMDRAA